MLVKNPDGSHRLRLGTAVDIPEQRLVRTRLEESEQRLAVVLASSYLGTWDCDIATHTPRFGPRREEVVGMAPNSFRGTLHTDFIQLVHPDDRARVIAHVDASVREPSTYRLEHRAVWRDDGIHQVQAIGRAYDDAATGGPTRTTSRSASTSSRTTSPPRSNWKSPCARCCRERTRPSGRWSW
jgi:PAS domain-containing protein